MEFHEKLQLLRKQKGLTQEELAETLYVSRAAVSKWESGRGLPNIDSLKAIATFYGVTIDELLSGDELLSVAETDHMQNELQTRSLVFGLLDCSTVLFLILPLFGQTSGGVIHSVSLLQLAGASPWPRFACCTAVVALTICGIAALVLLTGTKSAWIQRYSAVSLGLHTGFLLLLILCRQPYAAIFLLVYLLIKALLLLKRR